MNRNFPEEQKADSPGSLMLHVHDDKDCDEDEEEGAHVEGTSLERRLERTLHVPDVEQVGEDEVLAASEESKSLPILSIGNVPCIGASQFLLGSVYSAQRHRKQTTSSGTEYNRK